MTSLRDDRLRAGLTQDELAALSGVAQSTISHIETGKSRGHPEVHADLLAALAAASEDDPET